MLEDDGYTVYKAPDSGRGLDRLRGHRGPLVVLLDWLMPGMDGLEVLAALMAGDASLVQRHAFILLTALDTSRTLPAALPRDHAITLLGKPFELGDLLAAVARATWCVPA